jgi:hypothetical protein
VSAPEEIDKLSLAYWSDLEATGMAHEFTAKTNVTVANRAGYLEASSLHEL